LKRAFPQKAKCVPSLTPEGNAMTGQPKQALSDVNRRTGTSAAMIGLAISVTAHGLLLQSQGDSAIAAEPAASESTATVNSSTYDVAALSSASEASSQTDASEIQHAVQEGQTLWKIAQSYGVDAIAIARANKISLNSVLYVGQVLTIPLDHRIAPAIPAQEIASAAPDLYVPATEATTSAAPDASNIAQKSEQDAALDRLKQKRENLRLSLTQFKSVKAEEPVIPFEPAPPGQETTQQAMVQPEPDSSAPVTSAAGVTHRVLVGETLSVIARKYGVSLQELTRVNRVIDPNVVFAGQVLTIPQMQATSGDGQSSAAPTLVASANLSSTQASPLPSSLPNAVAANGTEFKPGAASPLQPVDAELSRPISLVNPVGASSQGTAVATAPFVRNQPTAIGETESRLRYNYVDNLRQEIVKLREKYRTAPTQTAANSAPKVAAASLNTAVSSPTPANSSRVNPEFNPADYRETVRSQVQRLRQRQNSGEQPAPAKKPASPQVLAAAPLGSQNYEPLLPSALGKIVSPELPPLGPVENYLPRNPGRFSGYIWPTRGVLTSGYGWRWGRMHRGIDIAGPVGTPIVAAASGTVITSGWNSGGYGYMVEIQHADGSITLYAHNNRLLVREGQYVEQGEQIAQMGSTGYSTGPHSHFEVHLPGQGAVNPMAYLPRSGA
jgi:murein DD-endopeptidase MepM/ murein hydrolase activator NlpD